jgi:hypothetical protein
VDELTQVQDLAPTLLELCEIAAPPRATFDGVSLAPLLRGRTKSLPDRILVTQFSRMNEPVPKNGDACVMWKRWRLVGGNELYDLAADSKQERNVLDQHPEIVQRLRSHYERWWESVAPRVNEHEAVVVGSEAENPLTLSPADWEDSFLDQGEQIRDGLRRNGAWNVEIAAAGTYEITLRRWWPEAETPIRSGLPGAKHADGMFPEGVALPVASVRLAIAGFDATKPVGDGDKAVTFEIDLPAGRTTLRTSMIDADGKEIAGAYYATVRRR